MGIEHKLVFNGKKFLTQHVTFEKIENQPEYVRVRIRLFDVLPPKEIKDGTTIDLVPKKCDETISSFLYDRVRGCITITEDSFIDQVKKFCEICHNQIYSKNYKNYYRHYWYPYDPTI